jgi:hypothetical protein
MYFGFAIRPHRTVRSEQRTCINVVKGVLLFVCIHMRGWSGTKPAVTVAILPALDDRWWWSWSSWLNEWMAGETEVLEENLPRAALSTIDPTWLDPGSNVDRRDGKPATDLLSYGRDRWGVRILPNLSQELRSLRALSRAVSCSSMEMPDPFDLLFRTCWEPGVSLTVLESFDISLGRVASRDS